MAAIRARGGVVDGAVDPRAPCHPFLKHWREEILVPLNVSEKGGRGEGEE